MTKKSMTRREMMSYSVAAGLLVSTDGNAAVVEPKPNSLLNPHAVMATKPEERLPYYDTVVIGSGYGGAVIAARLAASGVDLALFEKGKEWRSGEFPDRIENVLANIVSLHNPLGLYEFLPGPDIDVLSASGLGGTSLINANVLICDEKELFQRACWPTEIRKATDSDYWSDLKLRVLATLDGNRINIAMGLNKSDHLRSTASLARSEGHAAIDSFPHLAVNFKRPPDQPNDQGVFQNPCTFCGDCVTGCNVGAKNTLDCNYLALAKQHGAAIFTQTTIHYIQKLDDGGFKVHGTFMGDTGVQTPIVANARRVFVCAGSPNSAALLMRSKKNGLQVSSQLGKNFSGNGDVLHGNYNQKVKTNILGYGTQKPLDGVSRVGPTITTAVRHTDRTGKPFFIEDAAVPSALVDVVRWASAVHSSGGTGQQWQRNLKDLMGSHSEGALNYSMIYLGMGIDSARGVISLDFDDKPQINWPTVRDEAVVMDIKSAMRKYTAYFSGMNVDNPRSTWWGGRNLMTVHPLGGCAMASDAHMGVVNSCGQVFDGVSSTSVHKNLYVCDGSIFPEAVGTNPMLAIAMMAESIAERCLRDMAISTSKEYSI